MPSRENRKKAVAAYKEREQIGGIYRIINKKTGEKGPVRVTADFAALNNRYSFGQRTGSLFDTPEDEVIELERLEKKPGQSAEEFKADLDALFSLWKSGEK